MNIPTIITEDEDKVKFLYRVLELLRLEHNKKGADKRAGKITEKEFRDYQRYDFELRLQNVLHEINKIKETEGVTRAVVDEKGLLIETAKQKEFRQLKESGKIETKWDAEINIKTIEKVGRAFIPGSPNENFLNYTEEDPNSRIDVTSSRVTSALLTQQEDAYVYRDKGVDHFNGDFEHLFTRISSYGLGGSHVVQWSITNLVDDWIGIDTANGSGLAFDSYANTSTDLDQIFAFELDSGTLYNDYYNDTMNTIRYLKAKRDESVGTYGTFYVYVYSDATRETLVDTLSIAIHTSKKDYRYIYAVQTYNTGTANTQQSGYTENLDLQEPATRRRAAFMKFF